MTDAEALARLRIIFRPLAAKVVDKAREIAMTKIFVDATDEIADEIAASLHMRHYPFMCRDGHPQIGHWDSEDEICPLCRALAEADGKRRRFLPVGECPSCDRDRGAAMSPCHDASTLCESGKHPHCTCDTCF